MRSDREVVIPKYQRRSSFLVRDERSQRGMQFLLEFIVQTIFEGLGALIKRLFGRPPSKSGISEMWIGALVIVVVIVIVIAAAR